MSFIPTDLDIKLSFPFITVIAFALVLFMFGPAFDNRKSTAPARISILGALTAAAFCASLWNSGQFAFNGALIVDNYSLLSHLILIASFCAAAAHSSRSALPPSFHAWLTIALAGLMLVASAGNLLVLIAGAETASAAILLAARSSSRALPQPQKLPRADAPLSAARAAANTQNPQAMLTVPVSTSSTETELSEAIRSAAWQAAAKDPLSPLPVCTETMPSTESATARYAARTWPGERQDVEYDASASAACRE